MPMKEKSKNGAIDTAVGLLPSSSFFEISSNILEYALELTESLYGFAGYIDRYTGYLVCPTLSPEIFSDCMVEGASGVFKAFDNMFGWSIKNAAPFMTNDPSSESISRGTPEGHVPIKRFVCAPAIKDGKVIGLIGVANAGRDYNEADISSLVQLAAKFSDIITGKLDNDDLMRLSLAVDQVANGVVITDLDGNIQMVNKAFEKITGYTREEAMGKNPKILKSDYHSDEFYDEMWATINRGDTWHGRFRNKRKDGQFYWTDSIISPVKDRDGNIINYMAIKQDVTEKIKVEEALKKSEERQRVITGSARDAIMMIGADRKISFWNPAAEEMFGYSAEEALGRDFIDIIVPIDLIEVFKIVFEKTLSGGDKARRNRYFETEALKKNGQRFPMEMSVSTLLYEDAWHVVAISRDVTERMKLLSALQEKNDEMESFIYSVSHDLKSPLVTIEGFMGILEEEIGDLPDRDIEWPVERIKTATHKMKKMINDLLDYARLDMAGVEPENISFETAVNEALQTFELAIRDRGIKIKKTRIGVMMNFDRKSISHILQNLIGNSIKYIGDNNEAPEIEIGTYELDDDIVFYVRDNGMGIPPEDRDRVFMLFKRASNSSGQDGSGVGLAIIKKLVTKAGGRIWLESVQGEGSTFHLAIPDSSQRAASGAR